MTRQDFHFEQKGTPDSAGIESKTLDLTASSGYRTGTLRFRVEKGKLRPGQGVGFGVEKLPECRIAVSILGTENPAGIFIGKGDGSPPGTGSKGFNFPKDFKVDDSHEFIVTIDNGQIASLTLDGTALTATDKFPKLPQAMWFPIHSTPIQRGQKPNPPGLSFSVMNTVTCAACGKCFQAQVWLLIDVVERPDLADLIRTGRLNRFVCPDGHENIFDTQVALYVLILLRRSFYRRPHQAPIRCLVLAREQRANNEVTLSALANPDGALVFAEQEVVAIARKFDGRSSVGFGASGTKDWLLTHAPEADFLELSTHAFFDPANPSASAILLAHPGGLTASSSMAWTGLDAETVADLQAECQRLLLDEIWAGHLRLRPGCVVTADACETGQVGPGVFHESLGFPAAFLGAGAAGVIASLWAVDDLSTSLLMEKVYEFMLSRDRLRPPGALQRASRWLRCLPKHEVLTQLAFHIARLESALRNHEHLSEETFYAIHYQLRVTRARLIEVQNGSDRPFDDPFYWAAFAAYGV